MYFLTVFIKYLLQFYLIFNCLNPAQAIYLQYLFKLPVDITKLCPAKNYTCADGKPHFLCPARNLTKCENFQNIPVVGNLQTSFILGHNGIRNKVAEDWGIANMNLVHWSRELATMAQFYLQLCELNMDSCLVIGSNLLRVNKNYAIRHHLVQRWPGRIVRSWYLEIGYDVRSVPQFLKYHQEHNIANFTNMIRPDLEFIGCGAAFIKNSYFLIVCYYFPEYAVENLTEMFKFGVPCTKCKKTRNVCSFTFSGLCGIDVDLLDSSFMQLPYSTFVILLNCIVFLTQKYLK